MNKQPVPKKVVHLKTFENTHGLTPQRMHQKYAWGDAKCPSCGRVAVVRVISYVEFKELHRTSDGAMILMKLTKANDGRVPMVRFKWGEFVKLGEYYACSLCRKDMEKRLARSPSWVHHEFDEMPTATPLVQVH